MFINVYNVSTILTKFTGVIMIETSITQNKLKVVKDHIEINLGKITKKISIYNNTKTPNYYYYFRHNGVKYQGSSGSDDLETSKLIVREIFYDLTKGLRQKGRKKITKFEDVVEDFLLEKGKEENKLSPKTLVEYERQKKYLIEWYNDQSKGSDINLFFSKSRYKDYCDWRKKYYDTHDNIQTFERNRETIKGRKYHKVGETTLNRECRLLCSILRYGKKEKNILKDQEIPSYTMFPEKRREEILEYGDYDKLKKYWTKKNLFFWYCITTINNCGLRPNELTRIRYSDLHLKEGYILIRDRKNKNKNVIINSTVPIIGSTKETLQILKSRKNISKESNDFVFVTDNGSLVNVPYLSKQFKKSVKELIGKNMTLYNLRHNYITRMIKRRIPIKMISDVVGHTSTDMINKQYSHLMWDDYVRTFQESEKRIQEEREKQINHQTKTTT